MFPEFTEQDRRIFSYQYRGRPQFGDPLAVDRRLRGALGADADDVLRQANSPDPAIADPAGERLMDAVRHALQLPPFDPETGDGATEEDCRDALAAFDAFMQKKSGSSPTGSAWEPPSGTGYSPCPETPTTAFTEPLSG